MADRKRHKGNKTARFMTRDQPAKSRAVGLPVAPTEPTPVTSDVQIDAPARQTPQIRALRDPFVYLIALLPALILPWNRGYIYTPAGYLDPWIYYGYMRHLGAMKALFPNTYYGSRLSWILPGALVRSVLPSVPANYVLHLAVFFTAVFSLYWILKQALDARVAVLSAICMAVYPYFWSAVGGDYVDGAGIAYYLLTMALVFSAARQPRRYIPLIAAGAAYAGVIYSNLVWVAFSPAFFGFYLWSLAETGARNIWKATFRFIVWFGLGWAAVSAALGAANQVLEGNFWFYAPSLRFARSMAGIKNPWKADSYAWLVDGYWLILPGLGCLAAVVVCARFWRCGRGDLRLFFALNMFYSAGVLIYMEARGNPVLQYMYYASYMIPSTILVFGPVLFAGVSALRESSFRLLLGAAVGISLCSWAFSKHPAIAAFTSAHQKALLVAGIGIVVAGIALARFSRAALLGLTGLALICIVPLVSFRGVTNAAEEYRRIAAGMEAIEQVRDGQPLKFWFDSNDTYLKEFNSLNSCYLWAYSRINFQFPFLEKTAAFENGTLIVVPSSKPDVTAEAAAAFSGRTSVAIPAGRTRIESGGRGYWLHLFRIGPDPSGLVPFEISFDQGDSTGRMEAGPGGSTEIPLQLDHWKTCLESEMTSLVRQSVDGVLIDTSSEHLDPCRMYSQLIAGRRGAYRFVLKYQLLQGDVAFGALREDKKVLLQVAGRPSREGGDLVKEFTITLDQGQAIWLLAANIRGSDSPSSYLIKQVTAYLYKDPLAPSSR